MNGLSKISCPIPKQASDRVQAASEALAAPRNTSAWFKSRRRRSAPMRIAFAPEPQRLGKPMHSVKKTDSGDGWPTIVARWDINLGTKSAINRNGQKALTRYNNGPTIVPYRYGFIA